MKEQLGSGHSLDGGVASRMSAAFGYDFFGVRVHTDAKAGELSGQLNARAFTIGSDVAFAGGEYKPGTPIGDALIAHELAHVVQQGGGKHSDGPQTKDVALGDESRLEQDADRSAVGAVVASWTGTKKGMAEVSASALPRLKSGLQLQRCSKKPGPDLHAGATQPEAGKITDIQSVLNPTSTGGGGVPIPWDGHQSGAVLTAAETAARTTLKTDLTAKLNAHLAANMPAINAAAARRRLPIASLEGAGKGAKRVVDRHFGNYTAAAAFTPTQESTQRAFQFKAAAGPGKTLFDANDPAQRTLAGIPVDADDLASWIAETDTHARAVQAAHHFNKNRSVEERTFLQTEILDPFVAAKKPDLEKYDLFGFALTREKVVVPTTVEPGFSDVSVGGEPSDAERAAKWSVWKTLVHEYLHTRTHPTFSKAARGNRILIEGFTELFTKETLTVEIPKAPADAALRKEVEGGEFSPPTSAIIGPYDPGDYKDYLDGAEKLRNTSIGPPGGEAAIRDAYFLGHVEYLGLSPTGAVAAAVPPGTHDLITVPSGITSVAALAAAANVPEAVIRSANPGLALPLPAQVHVPGATDHIVVTAKNAPGPPSPKSENKSQIAAQHGISEKALERANPGLAWTTLAEGQHVLIPKH